MLVAASILVALSVTGCSSANTTGTAATTANQKDANSSAFLHRVQWSKMTYPLHCAPLLPAKAEEVTYLALSPGTDVAVVLLQCIAGDGTGLYNKTTSSDTVHLLQTLLDSADSWVPGALHPEGPFLTATTRRIELKVAGYVNDASRCCPNVFTTLTWTWTGRNFIETSPEPRHDE